MINKKLVNKITWGIAIVVLLFSASYGNKKVNSAVITELNIEIKETPKGSFVNEVNVVDRLNDFYSPGLIDTKVNALNIQELDSLLSSSPFIKKANSFTNVQGQLFIEVKQEVPLFRVINKKGIGYYVSSDAKKFPLSIHKAAKVPVATGNIDEEIYPTDSLTSKTVKQLYEVAMFLEQNEFFKALTGQLHVANNGDLMLITKSEERHDIILGDAQNLDSKFDNLYQFYTKVLSIKGWDSYKTINLKYKNQIVAKK